MGDFYDNIEPYLLGELSGPALTDFENALQSDPALAQSVARHRELTQRLDALRLRNKVKAALRAEPPLAPPFYAKPLFWTIAVSLVFLAAAFWFFYQPETPVANPSAPTLEAPQPGTPTQKPLEEQMPVAQSPDTPTPSKQNPALLALARQYHEPPAQGFVRDATQGTDASGAKTVVQQAAEAFSKKNYKEVATLLAPGQVVESDENARFLRANARFQLAQYAGAAADFDALKDSFQFRHEARWNLLLCQLALGKTASAKAMLSAMVSDQNFPFHDKALKLSRAVDAASAKE